MLDTCLILTKAARDKGYTINSPKIKETLIRLLGTEDYRIKSYPDPVVRGAIRYEFTTKE